MVFFTIKIFMMTRKHCSVFVCPSSLILPSKFGVRAVQKCGKRLPKRRLGGYVKIS